MQLFVFVLFLIFDTYIHPIYMYLLFAHVLNLFKKHMIQKAF